MAAGLAGLLGMASAAHAAGFALREGTPDWMGNAFAGDSAKAYDATTSYTNPAGMVRLNWNEIDAGLTSWPRRPSSAARISSGPASPPRDRRAAT